MMDFEKIKEANKNNMEKYSLFPVSIDTNDIDECTVLLDETNIDENENVTIVKTE